mgnify:FL=1|jgi:gas vesicle protein
MHIVLFLIGIGLGLIVGFCAGLIAKEPAKKERARKWKKGNW